MALVVASPGNWYNSETQNVPCSIRAKRLRVTVPVLPAEEGQLAQEQALCHASLFPHLRTADQGENCFAVPLRMKEARRRHSRYLSLAQRDVRTWKR